MIEPTAAELNESTVVGALVLFCVVVMIVTVLHVLRFGKVSSSVVVDHDAQRATRDRGKQEKRSSVCGTTEHKTRRRSLSNCVTESFAGQESTSSA